MNVLSQPKFAAFFGTFFVLLGLDQASKAYIRAYYEVGADETQIIDGYLSMVHAQNFGAAFSSFEGMWGLFMVFTVVAVLIVLDLLRRLRPDATFTAGILGTILSGALGNGIDRARIGHVTDFIRVYAGKEPLHSWFVDRFGTDTWPIFNIADSVLLIGVSLFLVHYLFLEEGDEGDEESEDDVEPAAEIV